MKLVLIAIIALLSPFLAYAKTIYIVPVAGHDVNKLFFDPFSYRDEVAKPFYMLRKALVDMGYEVRFTFNGENLEDATAVLSFNEIHPKLLENLSKLPKKKCFLFILEPPVVIPTLYNRNLSKIYGKIFVLFDNIVDSKNYYKFFYPQPRDKVIQPIPDFLEKKLCVFISGNWTSSHPDELYSERRKLVSFFMSKHSQDFDLYGRNWGDFPAQYILNKWDVIKKYRFCFCYENMKNQDGYITEKIFDAMIGGSVPVYLGATNIHDYVPKTCFIDRRDFSSNEELYHFLKTMDRNTYISYIESIKKYFQTPQAHLFSIEHFIQIIIKSIQETEQEKK